MLVAGSQWLTHGVMEEDNPMQPTRTIEVVDYGIDHAQYFTGHGTAYTEFEYSSLGAGDSLQDALDDALESASQWNAPSQEAMNDVRAEYADYAAETVTEHCRRYAEAQTDNDVSDDEIDTGELYYYVGIRWNA